MSYPYQYPPPDQYGGYPPPAGQQQPYGQPQGYPTSYPPPGGPPSGYPASQPPYGGYPPPPPSSGYNQPYGAPPGPPGGYGAPPGPPPGSGYPGAQYPPPAGGQSVPPAPSHPGYNPSYMPLSPPAGQHGHYAPPQPSGPPPPQSYYPPPGQAPPHGYSETYLGAPVSIPNHPSPPLHGFDAQRVAEKIRKAMKGFGTDERALIESIAPLDALQVDAVKKAFETLTGKGLIKEVESEISGYFEYVVRAKLLGPIGFDCWVLERACSGAGTDESLLNEILLDRSNFEINVLKATFRSMYNKDLTSVIRSELTSKTERLFNMALVGNRDLDTPYVDQAKQAADVQALYKAGKGKIGTDEVTISSILVTRAPNHLRAVIKAYGDIHGRLSKDIKSEFSGHMEDALLYIVKGYESDGNGVDRDAEKIYKAMEGMGTKDERLITRVIRAHWNQPRFNAIKSRFHAMYGKTLVARIRSEISGEYKEFMAAVAGESSPLQSNYSNVHPPTAPYVAAPTNHPQGPFPVPPSHVPTAQPSLTPAIHSLAAPGVAAHSPPSVPPSSVAPSNAPPQIPPALYPPGYPSGPSHPPGYPPANLPAHQPLVSPVPAPGGVLTYLGVAIPPPPPNPPNMTPLPGFNVDGAYEAVRKAMKGFGTDEKALTQAIAPLDAFQVEALKRTFETKTGKPLIKEVEREVSGTYEFALRAKLLGPVLYDCWLLNRAFNKAGVDEATFIEILLDRSNLEINTLKQAFKATYNLDLLGVIKAKSGLFSGKSERMFNMALNQDRDPDGPLHSLKLEEDVKKLHEAGEGRMGTDEMTFCVVLITRSPSHLRAVAQAYAQAHRRLSSAVKGEFSGTMKHALMHIALSYEGDGYGVERDAELIHEAMKGMGTQDERLITRIIRAHWNKPRFFAIKAAYERKYGESLLARVRKETSGDYKDFMCAIVDSR